MLQRSAGARGSAGAGTVSDPPTVRGRDRSGRPIGPWAFAGVAIASLGGPLALAALSAPGLVDGADQSAGLAMVAAAVVFIAPLAIWLRYSQDIHSSGGLFAFVEAAAGRRVALLQATMWTVSYVLYLVYTTVQIVYDLLPAVFPGESGYQTALALAIPVALAGVMIAGRAAALLVIGLMAAGQMVLAGVLDGVTVANLSTPASSFSTGAPAHALAQAGAQTSLLYICASLPLFLGGELARPRATIRRGMSAAFALTAVVVVLAVAPLAATPGLLHTAVPGVTVAQEFAGPGLAKAIGVGVAVSIAGVILCEYVAVTRLVAAVTRWRMRPITVAVGAVMVAAAPLSLIDPEGFYNALVKPSLIALWLSQLIVFLVYPRFARARHQGVLSAWILSLVASGLALYGLWTAVSTTTS